MLRAGLIAVLVAIPGVGVSDGAAAAAARDPVAMRAGLAVVEAEDADGHVPRGHRSWVAGRRPARAVGTSMRALPDRGTRVPAARAALLSPELRYRVRFPKPGAYRVWVRLFGRSDGRTVHIGLDGTVSSGSGGLLARGVGSWGWRSARITVGRRGVHTVHIWMGDDGALVDRLVVSDDPRYEPTGAGPYATGRPAAPIDSGSAPAPSAPAPDGAPPAAAEPGPPVDSTPPSLVDRLPQPGATAVGADAGLFVRFTEAVDPSTLTPDTVRLARSAGGPPVAATIVATEANRAIALRPIAGLLPDTEYTVTVGPGVRDAAGNALAAAVSWRFTTRPPDDATPPAVSERLPAPQATSVGPDVELYARFSEPVNPMTLTGATVQLAPSAGGDPVPATIVVGEGNTALTLRPSAGLLPGTAYTVTIGTGVRDGAGNPLAAPVSWSFTTGPSPPRGAVVMEGGRAVVEAEDFDVKAARSGDDWLAGRSPVGFAGTGALQAAPDDGSGAQGEVVTTSAELAYRVRFEAPGTYHLWIRGLAPNTAGNSVHAGLDGVLQATSDGVSTARYGEWTWFQRTIDGPAAILEVPSAGEHSVHLWMREDGLHVDRLLLTREPADVPTGNGPVVSRREGGPDTMPPVVMGRRPSPGAAVPQGSDVVITFSEPIDAATATAANVTLTPVDGASPVPATVAISSDGAAVTLAPEEHLAPGTAYRVTVAPGIRDRAGNALARTTEWTFTTRVRERYEPPDGEIYSGVSTRSAEGEAAAFLASSGQPSVAIHNRYSRNFGQFGGILSDLQSQPFAGMISWAIVGNAYSPDTPGGSHASVARGDVDAYILDRAAEVRAFGRPLFLRLHWEMNGDSFSWNVYGGGSARPGNSHADFRSSWRRAVILFRGGTRPEIDAALAAVGMPPLTTAHQSVAATTNVAWTWTPASKSASAFDDVHAYWPGEEFVDWVGVDWYPPATGDVGLHLLRAQVAGGPDELYDRYSGPDSRVGKPFLVGEWGVRGADRPQWVSDMFAWMAARPQVKAQLYFNIAAADGSSRLQEFPASAAAFREGVADERWIRDVATL